MKKSSSALSGDGLLYGVKHIASHLGVRPRQALYLIEAKRLPIFREGRVICATRATLNDWLTARGMEAGKASA